VTGTAAGAETVALTLGQMPPHIHGIAATTAPATSSLPSGGTGFLAAANANGTPYNLYGANANAVPIQALGSTGAGSGHANMQPYLVIDFAIALTGTYPPRP
jgi:microcystin-dependent protein